LNSVLWKWTKRFDQRFVAIDQRFEAIDQRFEAVDKRFDAVDQRFDAVDKRFDDMNRHIDDMANMLRAEMRTDRAETNAKLDSILAFMANIDQRVMRPENQR
jgi:DNA anti-recombination protein RmuC